MQAIRWLVEEILPAATERVPRLRLHLVADTDGTMASLGGQFAVTVSAETVDVAYEAVDVVVLTQRGAPADPTPALAAFAHRIPVVAHPDAVADLEVTDGDHVLLAETAPGFASAIQHALDAHATRPHLTVAAHRLWDTTYRADVVAGQVVDLARHLTGKTQDS